MYSTIAMYAAYPPLMFVNSAARWSLHHWHCLL